MILGLNEETVRRLAIRVLSRGISSLEFIQSQLVAQDESDGPLVNAHGFPVRQLAVREGTSNFETHDEEDLDVMPGPSNRFSTPNRQATTEDSSTSDRPAVAEGPPTPDRPGQPTPPVPEWCKCGHCRQMTRPIESLCCKKKKIV